MCRTSPRPGMKIHLCFLLDWPASPLIAHKIASSYEAMGILVLVMASLLYDHVVSVQAYDPTTNIALVH